MAALAKGRLLALVWAPAGPFHSLGYRLSLGIVLLGAAAALAWVFVGWGAYRSLHDLGKGRSTLAGVLAAIAWVPVWALTLLLANALLK